MQPAVLQPDAQATIIMSILFFTQRKLRDNINPSTMECQTKIIVHHKRIRKEHHLQKAQGLNSQGSRTETQEHGVKETRPF